jgi:calcineurin-like phosphoesterase family protein
MTVWFTSDLHLGHAAMPATGRGWRPFETQDEHDETLIERHNALVGHDDVVWVVGDVAMGKIEDSLAKCARMNGMRNLICGNHDRPAMTADVTKRNRWTRRYLDEGGFAAVLVLDDPLSLPVNAMQLSLGPDRNVTASHYPYEGDHSADERYADRRPIDQGEWLLHGHVHGAWKVRGRQVNVGVDVWDFAPVERSRIIELIDASETSPAPG